MKGERETQLGGRSSNRIDKELKKKDPVNETNVQAFWPIYRKDCL